MPTFPKTRRRDLVFLLALLVRTRLGGGDVAQAATEWLRRQTRRYESADIVLDLIVRRILFVSGPELSTHILAAEPSVRSLASGSTKKKAMAFLAPNALTILDGEAWRVYRSHNETVLQTGRAHAHLPAILDQVRKTFATPVGGMKDVRRRMGEVMLATVFGEGNAPAHLIDDIQELFAEVGLKTALLGSRKKALRDRFRDEIGRLWRSGADAAQPSLVELAHEASGTVDASHRREDMQIDQIPHWMFTFTNSGSDLLARSLAMVTARDDAIRRARDEIASAGAPETPASVHGLSYLEACIHETGRLYPPVVQASHRAESDDRFDGLTIPAGTEIVQFFPFTNRDASRDPLADSFRPERWLDQAERMQERYPNLFLSGARACPGRNLILFVIKSALALQLGLETTRARPNALTSDPLPFSFPRQLLSE